MPGNPLDQLSVYVAMSVSLSGCLSVPPKQLVNGVGWRILVEDNIPEIAKLMHIFYDWVALLEGG